MYKITFVNFDYDSANQPETIDEAKKVARNAGFQSIVSYNGEVVGTYCPMLGWKNYKENGN